MHNSIKSKRTKTSQKQTKRYSYKRNQKRNQKKGIAETKQKESKQYMEQLGKTNH